MLEVDEIVVFRGNVRILDGVTIEVKEGEIVALIGGNGAGKTTTLQTISGVLRPVHGRLTYRGKPIHSINPWDVVGLGIAHIPEGRELFRTMTVEDNLIMGSYLPKAKTVRKDTMKRMYELFPRLEERRLQVAGTLSGGEQQMLAIARGLMSLPQILLLDEPSLGLAALLVSAMFEIIRQIRAEGVSILLVEQNVRSVLEVADRAYVLEHGRIVMAGPSHALINDERVQRAYLGVLGEER
jgi:branched-chain amino acid transport system ATP-binding protein